MLSKKFGRYELIYDMATDSGRIMCGATLVAKYEGGAWYPERTPHWYELSSHWPRACRQRSRLERIQECLQHIRGLSGIDQHFPGPIRRIQALAKWRREVADRAKYSNYPFMR